MQKNTAALALALVSSSLCGALASYICVTADNVAWGALSALSFGIISGFLFARYLRSTAFAFVVGEVLSFFIPMHDPFGQAGFVLVGLLPILGIFVAGSLIGNVFVRYVR